MKKIILSKVHRSPSPEGTPSEEGCTNKDVGPEAGSSSQETDKPPFQPPLPIGPPPPDSPTRIQIKQEKLDDGYQDTLAVKIPIFDVKCKQEVAPVDPRPTCRRFARGTCINGSTCMFKHEVDLAKLKFCWDFQNKKCTRLVCKHVHATIFEEQHYYRTGYLPPSALAHQKNQNVMQNKETSSANLQVDPKNQPQREGNFQTLSPLYEDEATKLKRLWDEYSVGGGRPDFVSSGPLEKKCKNCDKKQFSLDEATNEMKNTLRSLVRLKEETSEVDRKTKRLFHFVQSLVTLNSMFPGKDIEGLFTELLEVAKHNNALSSGSPSH